MGWEQVEDSIMGGAILVAFDGCHKAYTAEDEEQAAWFRAEYPHVVEGTPRAMLDALQGWFAESCPLRFIQAVRTDHSDPNAGFRNLIAQGEDEGEDMIEEEEEAWR